MKEIKFRAWHLGNWDEKRHRWIHEPRMIYDDNPGDCLVYYNQGQNIKQVMQYIGFKDVYGIEIYEGDILDDATGSIELKHVVTLDPNSPDFIFDQFGYEDFRKLVGEGKLKIIGNIYENPELIKEI